MNMFGTVVIAHEWSLHPQFYKPTEPHLPWIPTAAAPFPHGFAHVELTNMPPHVINYKAFFKLEKAYANVLKKHSQFLRHWWETGRVSTPSIHGDDEKIYVLVDTVIMRMHYAVVHTVVDFGFHIEDLMILAANAQHCIFEGWGIYFWLTRWPVDPRRITHPVVGAIVTDYKQLRELYDMGLPVWMYIPRSQLPTNLAVAKVVAQCRHDVFVERDFSGRWSVTLAACGGPIAHYKKTLSATTVARRSASQVYVLKLKGQTQDKNRGRQLQAEKAALYNAIANLEKPSMPHPILAVFKSLITSIPVSIDRPFAMPAPPITLVAANTSQTGKHCRYGWIQFRRVYQALLASDLFRCSPDNVASFQYSRGAWKELLKMDKWPTLFDTHAVPRTTDKHLECAATTIRELLSKCGVPFPSDEPNTLYFGKVLSDGDLQNTAWRMLIVWDVNEHAVHQDLLLIAYHFLRRNNRNKELPPAAYNRTIAAIRACMADRVFDFKRNPTSPNGFGDKDMYSRRKFIFALSDLMQDWKVLGLLVLPLWATTDDCLSHISYVALEKTVVTAYMNTFLDSLDPECICYPGKFERSLSQFIHCIILRLRRLSTHIKVFDKGPNYVEVSIPMARLGAKEPTAQIRRRLVQWGEGSNDQLILLESRPNRFAKGCIAREKV
ncbi:hypothetical protein PUNSTDRAFT_45104 [Punctularia strigosozonata HHB-11173 SS5]|uniref:uncharacterized protein n=1 Tax=Punctularia strigosozonata (strain HHB-11173) TaxID=741275 RepID=UPI000441662C|nr:uncharacterized protein PUNSTDRAFT_45104 [Punctularia strigosozonata HHB-11173 SS5]EIN08676.1 hypothetical protein PUNSTDRAFT_45104 [Punctularia strigosozonata HHB-11173 SS5]